jgi:hypothetical protein
MIPRSSPSINAPAVRQLFVALAVSKAAGLSIAWLLQHPKLAALRSFVASRNSSRPLLDYAMEWKTSIATEAAVVALEALAFSAIGYAASKTTANQILTSAALADALTLIPFPRPIRAVFSPLPLQSTTRDALSKRALPEASAKQMLWTFGCVQAIRTSIRTAVVLTRRWARRETYLTPAALVVQPLAHGAVAGLVTHCAVCVTFAMLRNRQAGFWTWAAVYGVSWASCSALSTRLCESANVHLQSLTATWLYYRLPGVRNARGRVFDLRELDQQFSSFSATELSEVSQFANEALRSAAIDQNVRLHAVRFLASLTSYVRAVNTGALNRSGRITSSSISLTASSAGTKSMPSNTASAPNSVSSFSTDADFESHTFTEKQISERLSSNSEPFSCARCSGEFRPKDKASVLPCGHILHSGACSQLTTDWCPQCVRPTHSPSTEERMAVFVGMKVYVEKLASHWESTLLIPPSLHYAEWGYVAQYVRRHNIVEGEVPLDVVPSDHVPGTSSLLDVPIAGALWALRLLPTENSPHLFTLKKGW